MEREHQCFMPPSDTLLRSRDRGSSMEMVLGDGLRLARKYFLSNRYILPHQLGNME